LKSKPKLLQQYEVQIPDSFVQKNKLRTKENDTKKRPSNGEARLYLGSVSNEVSNLFYFDSNVTHRNKNYKQSTAICYFEKKNLLSYMMLAEHEYFHPAQNYFYDISANYYDLLKEIQRFQTNKLTFHVFHHPGPKDGVRFYINSTSPIWSLFRRISLPHITKLSIKKILNENQEIEFSFKLKINKRYTNNSDKTFKFTGNTKSPEVATNILARK